MDQLIDGGGCPIFVSVSNAAGDRPWLVFSNSLMTDRAIWDAQVQHFAQRFNILRYDQRGHGRSGLTGPVDFDVLSGDVLTLLDHFAIESCIYVGLSMGVPTGLNLAGKHPSRVSKLILSDGQMATLPTGRQVWQSRIDAARANGMGWVAEDTIRRWFAPEFVAAGRVDFMLESARNMQVEGYSACAAVLQGYDFVAVAGALSVPVQLLAGSNDGAMPQTMQVMAQTIPNAQFALIDGAGHIPNVEQPERFNQAMEAFLSPKGLKTN